MNDEVRAVLQSRLVNASFRGDSVMPSSVSWPMARVEVTDEGVTIDLAHWALRPLVVFLSAWRRPLWSATWANVRDAHRSARGVVMENGDGRICEFWASEPRQIDAVWAAIAARRRGDST